MTRSRGIGRGRAPGSRRTQFGRGGHQPEQPAGTERETGGARALPRRDTRKRGSGVAAETPRGDPAGGGIAYGELVAGVELAEAEVGRLRSELVEVNGKLTRQSREWSLVLQALGAFPAAREAVLDAVLSPEEAERAAAAGQAPAGASVAGPGGGGVAGQPAGVPLPEGKREEPTVYDGAGRRPVPPGWGGRIESGRPRQRGVDGIGDRYEDSGPLTSAD